MIADYYSEMFGYESYVHDYGFFCYTIQDDSLLVHEFYVQKKGNARHFFQKVVELCKENGCKHLRGIVRLKNKDATRVAGIYMHYGANIVNADNGNIYMEYGVE